MTPDATRSLCGSPANRLPAYANGHAMPAVISIIPAMVPTPKMSR